ncbi:MAG: TetR/AcrR family transcriptional regulator [Pleurocapsa sp.]
MKTSIDRPTPKERILTSVNRLFYEQGYLATGINQIITEAQVAKASFYQYFPSKEDLVLEYLTTYNTNFFKELKLIEQQFDEPKARILALFDSLADFSLAAECRGCAVMNIAVEFSDPHSKPRQLIIQYKQELKTFIEQLVLQSMPDNNSPKLARTKATAVYLLYEAALIESRVHQDIWSVETSKAIVNHLLS